MSEIKLSPKIMALCRWPGISQVNERLDRGESPARVAEFAKINGFDISNPIMYQYAKIRKQALSNGINIEHMIGLALKPTVTDEQKNKLKSEIDLLDGIIQGGYETLKMLEGKPIPPKLTMDAIKLKAELTGGSHGFLTNYGMETLKNIEQKKYEMIISHILGKLTEDTREETIKEIPELEYNYYKKTEYFEEYLRATGEYSEKQIRKLVKENMESEKE